ncbi:MAG: response regulator transcription factor [Gammaproteobacteria bacterium]|nr:response regulator transcription factor [Gammaproteobacteria bacterium]
MRLLVIEDDLRIADFLRRALEAEGYQITHAVNGTDGLRIATALSFDIVILDLMLPDMSGHDVCHDLRKREIDVSILMLTALSEIEDKITGFKSGADDYLTKPFAFEELLARLAALTRRHSAAKISHDLQQIVVGDLVMNLKSFVVTRAKREITLTAKEFNLLKLLALQAGKVVSRTTILDSVWGYNADPLTNVVDVYIRHLRTKIDKDERVQLIHTVRGFGYKLVAHETGRKL